VKRTDGIEIIDVTDATAFAILPPCADPRFDHRSCDYWEDEVHGSKAARVSWWLETAPTPRPRPRPSQDNPFAPPVRDDHHDFNPFAVPAADPEAPSFNPFAPAPAVEVDEPQAPRKLRLLSRGRTLFGSYAKVLLRDGEPAVFAQFGPLSAYPRAQRVRDLYPRLPSSPLPAVITCIASTSAARGDGLGRRLVEAVVDDLADRGFAAVEAYPDLTLRADEASAATPAFWERCGFTVAASDERYPVMRRSL
jgi:ribosomal protein S18 acetylase RimI-like enzyme